jgi:cobalamin biosynthesis protein CobT
MYLNKAECENNFSQIYNSQPSGLGATRANLLRLLRSLDLVGWSTHEESGRLDRKAFTRFATGSTAIFSKREYREAETSAVSILIDCSGSMNDYDRIEVAESVAIQLSRILDKANVPFNVTGFRGSSDVMHKDATGASGRLVVKYEAPSLIPFKTWRDSLQRASAKLGSINRWANSATPDYSSITLALEDLASRSEFRKILFLLTDANGYNITNMKFLQSVADREGIKIVAIGIGNTDVKECFRSAENVRSVGDLTSTSFNKLLKELQ